jgi:diguanylate cyclase (GGDEF)-like protein
MMKLLPAAPGYFDSNLELRYRARQNEQALSGTRVLMLMAAVALVMFGIWDYSIDPTTLTYTLPIRALGTAVILVLFSGTYHRQLRTRLSWFLFGNTVTCTTIVAWVLVIVPNGLMNGLPNFFFVPLSFVFLPNYRAVALNCMVLMLIVNAFQLAYSSDQQAVINTNIFLSAMCAVTGVYAWVNEARNRQMFRLEVELERLATTDSLSGAFNRRHFTRCAEAEIARARRYGHSLSLLLLDIDYFKSINDNYGHQTGDIAIRAVADACRNALRQSDYFGRMGGEEFAILLPETTLEAAGHLAERLRANLEKMLVTAESNADSASDAPSRASQENAVRTLSVTASIGVSTWHGQEDSLEALLQRADNCLYNAKDLGRNKVVISQISLPTNVIAPTILS